MQSPPSYLVVDLNEVLVKKFYDKRRRMPKGDCIDRAGNHWVLRSPAADLLFDAARRMNFKIVIWSSSSEWTVNEVTRVALADGKDVIMFLMNRQHCERDDEFPRIENDQNWAVIKDLRTFWDHMKSMGHLASASNTLIVDDDANKTRRQPDSAVIVPPYKPQSSIRNAAYDAEYLGKFKSIVIPRMQKLVEGQPLSKTLRFDTPEADNVSASSSSWSSSLSSDPVAEEGKDTDL